MFPACPPGQEAAFIHLQEEYIPLLQHAPHRVVVTEDSMKALVNSGCGSAAVDGHQEI